MTLNELFEKYPGLNNPTESGVEFFQFVKGDPNKDNLVVITSMELKPGEKTFSGDDEDGNVGEYLLSFPYHARNMIFATVDDIDAHLTKYNGKFRLPGYRYKD